MQRLKDNPARRQILLRIDEDIYERISQMSLAQNKSKTLVINELLKQEIYKETMPELFDIANVEIKESYGKLNNNNYCECGNNSVLNTYCNNNNYGGKGGGKIVFIPRPPSDGGNFTETYRREKMEEYHIEVVRDTKKGNNAFGERYENNDYVLFYDKKEKKKYTVTKDMLAYFCKVLFKKWDGGYAEELEDIRVDTLGGIEFLEDKIEELAYYADVQHIDERQHLQRILKLLIMQADCLRKN